MDSAFFLRLLYRSTIRSYVVCEELFWAKDSRGAEGAKTIGGCDYTAFRCNFAAQRLASSLETCMASNASKRSVYMVPVTPRVMTCRWT
jgi:hypothetical protein